ncbi:MAG: cation:proton antiporter [Acidobacteriota bacterium]|nr:cation:proton antiporter [Acidobacteriota bacterium]
MKFLACLRVLPFLLLIGHATAFAAPYQTEAMAGEESRPEEAREAEVDNHGKQSGAEDHDDHAEEDGHGEEHSITHQMMVLVLQLALIVLVARMGGEIFERFLKQPSVLGELAAGMLIGPYALGPYLDFGAGALFPLMTDGQLPVTPELYGVATVASIILLFMVGLETDFYQFMRYSGPGAAVGVGGVLGSFITGDLLYVWFTGSSFMSPDALFMGTVSTATSVGITARVLSEKKKLDSPEGTTILAGAVIDDVLGILILAIVGGIAVANAAGSDGVAWGRIGIIALKAFGFWLGATAVGIVLSKTIARGMMWFRTAGSITALGFGLALLLAGIAETFGLAMIIGAYIMGLSLSKEEISHHLERRLMPVYACFVPIFFAVMGMLVDFQAMGKAFVFGLIYSVVAIVSKVLGSGLPCFLVGFNSIGAARIGIGMLPRGEVALIVAGVGVSQGFIGTDMFGVVIMMTLVTTIMAPPILVGLFNVKKPGLRLEEEEMRAAADELPEERIITIGPLTWNNHELLISCIQNVFFANKFTLNTVNADQGIYRFSGRIEGENCSVQLSDHNESIHLKTMSRFHERIHQLVTDAHEQAADKVTGLQIRDFSA